MSASIFIALFSKVPRDVAVNYWFDHCRPHFIGLFLHPGAEITKDISPWTSTDIVASINLLNSLEFYSATD